LLYMVQSRKGHVLFLSNGFRTGTAWSVMTRRIKIEIQVLDERTGTSGLSTSCMLTKFYAVLQAPNDDLAGNRLGNPADCDDAVNIAAILVPILPKQPELTRGIEPLTC
jgi:hypothetical protein